MRDERGLVLPATAMVATICTVAIAAVGFVLSSHRNTQSPPDQRPASSAHRSTPTPSPTASTRPSPRKTHHHKPRVDKKTTYVEVFNNSNVKGLAGRTAARAQDAGWNVVGADNWYGTVDASTVYFPRGLRPAALALGHDLGITRFRPAIQPMRLDRLTVILTADYTG